VVHVVKWLWEKISVKYSEEAMEAVLNEELYKKTGESPGDGKGTSPEIHIDEELNLKGKVCPYTFIESMMALEEMKIGEVLRVIVDYAPSVCDVPKTLAREGYEVLDVSKVNETDWAIVVRNREFQEG
jgi:tRNA 2-thiouridine synthesizing protein A